MSHAATGEPIRCAWSEMPYGEEVLTRLVKELQLAMAASLERMREIHRRLENSQQDEERL